MHRANNPPSFGGRSRPHWQYDYARAEIVWSNLAVWYRPREGASGNVVSCKPNAPPTPSTPPAPPQAPFYACQDVCFGVASQDYNGNGACEDGGAGASESKCPLGSDCYER